MSTLIVETLLKSSLLLSAAAAANVLVFRRRSAASRHLVWTCAVIGLLLMPVFSAALPRWELPIRVAGARAPSAVPIEAASANVLSEPTTTGRQTRTTNPVEAGASAGLNLPTWRDETVSSAIAWVAILPAAYALGVFLLLIRVAVERWCAHRLVRGSTVLGDPDWTGLLLQCARRMGVDRPVRLLRSRDQTMPMALGTRPPAIVIPAVADTWTDERRQAVLLHELAHIARHDCLTQIMAAVACALYWFHPGVWWIARRLRVERELACDDRVLGVGAEARDYAGHLLELAYALGGHRAPALAVTMARRHRLEGRVLAILDSARNRALPTLMGRLAGIAITVLVLVPLAAVEATLVPVEATAVMPLSAEPAQTNSFAQATVLQGMPGTWEIRPSSTAGLVQLRLAESDRSSSSFTVPIGRLEGLSAAQLAGSGRVEFRLRRDAGSFAFEGTMRSLVGAGTYTFSPSTTFPDELVKRRLDRPTAAEQYLLARADIGFAFLDELTGQGYSTPSVGALVQTARHGVHLDFLREMGQLGYRLGRVDALIKLADHGVSPGYIRELRAQGLSGLSADDLVRARDHGVDAEYVRELRTLGYGPLTLDALQRARDHGISPDYVKGMRGLGYRLTLEDLVKARDHGVDVEYIRAITALGYERLSLEALIGARDHGIDAEYVRDLRDLGYRPTLEDLVKARDHGVDPKYVRDFKALGYTQLPLEDLIRLRDHGVTPQYAGEIKNILRGQPSVEDLIRQRDAGFRTGARLRSLNEVFRDAHDRLTTSLHDIVRALLN